MSAYETAKEVFWIGGLIGHVITLSLILYRRAFVRFPVFAFFLLFHIARSIFLLVAKNYGYLAYFYGYWSTEALDVTLTLLVLQELFRSVLRFHRGLTILAESMFRWGTVFLLGVCILTAVQAPGTERSRLVAGMLLLQRSGLIVECGLVLQLFLMVKYFGIKWDSRTFGIALGLGLGSSLAMLGTVMWTRFGSSGDMAYVLLFTGGYDLGIVVWILSFLKSREEIVYPSALPDAAVLRRWDDLLGGMERR